MRPQLHGDRLDDQIRQLFEDGKTVKATAEILDLCTDAVRRRRKAMGIVTPRGRAASLNCGVKAVDEHNSRIAMLWESGFSIIDIAFDPDIYLHRCTVGRRLREMGYDTGHRYQRHCRFTAQELKTVKFLYEHENNYSLEEIAHMVGLKYSSSVRSRLKKVPGITMRTASQTGKIAASIKKRKMNGTYSPPSPPLGIQFIGRNGDSDSIC